MSLTELLVPSYTQMLRALSTWLDKAAVHAGTCGTKEDMLLSMRLAPDMYPLASQDPLRLFPGTGGSLPPSRRAASGGSIGSKARRVERE